MICLLVRTSIKWYSNHYLVSPLIVYLHIEPMLQSPSHIDKTANSDNYKLAIPDNFEPEPHASLSTSTSTLPSLLLMSCRNEYLCVGIYLSFLKN